MLFQAKIYDKKNKKRKISPAFPFNTVQRRGTDPRCCTVLK